MKREFISVILLAGGKGSRMQSEVPKQYLNLGNKPLVQYSFEVFLSLEEINEIVVVCDPSFQHLFSSQTKPVNFALPGERRQDSLYNGLQQTSPQSTLICVHDAARPCIDQALVKRVLEAGTLHGAATVGQPVRFTIKQTDHSHFVTATPPREYVWEIQTPQVVKKSLLEEGFAYAIKNKITVTDDVSLVELCGHPVKLVEGSPHNIKVTLPSDLTIAEQYLML